VIFGRGQEKCNTQNDGSNHDIQPKCNSTKCHFDLHHSEKNHFDKCNCDKCYSIKSNSEMFQSDL
jgi:hypothetical protein